MIENRLNFGDLKVINFLQMLSYTSQSSSINEITNNLLLTTTKLWPFLPKFVLGIVDHLPGKTSYDSTEFNLDWFSFDQPQTTILSSKTAQAAFDLASFILETIFKTLLLVSNCKQELVLTPSIKPQIKYILSMNAHAQ